MKEIVLGFSGGTDSYTATKILLAQGFRVRAVILDLMGDSEAILKARQLSGELGVELDVIDAQSRFKSLVEANFLSEYLAGRTPAPCTLCNRVIKWSLLRDYADAHGIESIATGHYFRVVEHNSHLYVSKARDPRKDQSYYLWTLDQELLRRVVTPMADIIKEDIKGLSPIRGESMGVCFLRGRGYSDYITHSCGEQPRGSVVDRSGTIVGEHNGIAHYTIGQKRGEGIPQGLSVAAINATTNSIVVDRSDSLFCHELTIGDCNIVNEKELLTSHDIRVMVRGIGRNPDGFGSIKRASNGYHITLSSPAWAVASGQPIVLYRGDRVIGGGILNSAL